MLNRMHEDGIVDTYAIGGAVGGTFYISPSATFDLDVFITLRPPPGKLILDPQPIFAYLTAKGCTMEGEYVVISGWPVQFLAPPGPLVEEALQQASNTLVDDVSTRVFTAEHLA